MNSGIELRDCFKTYSHDQDKARTPAETIRWVRDRLSGFRLNLLSRTLRIDTGRLDVPVFLSLCGDDAILLTGTKKQMGKGATLEQSEASALMELVERFSFFSFVRETRFPLLTWEKVPGSAVSAEVLKLSIHDSRTPTGRCEAFLKGCPLRWAVARSLTENRDRWLPIDWFYLINEYNGPAAGNTLEEAILQSLCEVVERHVGSVIAYEERVTPRIDPSSVKDPAAVELLEKFHRNGIQLHLRDFSLNTGIPSVGVLAYDPANFPEKSEIVFAVGTTPSPEKSLCRALTEVAQLAGDFESRTSYRPTLPKYKSLEEAAYLMAPGPTVAIQSLPDLSDHNLRVEIERCVGALRDMGLEVLVLDATHPELQVPAVYTVIPGAHFLDHTRDTDFPQHMARTVIRGLPPESAAAQLERLHNLFGPRYDLTFFLAHGHELLGNVEKALGLFEEALRQKPDPREIASIYVHMASCRKELGDYRGALRALEYAERRNWELKEIYNLRGFCYYRLKEHYKAIEAFERAIELDPGSAIDYANIGSNLRELGHKEEAVRLYRMALELDPSIDFARENIQRLEAEIQAARG